MNSITQYYIHSTITVSIISHFLAFRDGFRRIIPTTSIPMIIFFSSYESDHYSNCGYITRIIGSSDCMVCLWEMDTLDLLNTIALPGPVHMLDISVDSMFLLVLCEGNQLWLHALATGTLIHNLKGYCSKVMSIALAEDCQRAVVAGVDSRVYIYDIHSGDLDLVPISTSPHHKEVIAVKITNNDDFLITAGEM